MERKTMSDKRYALLAACLIPVCTLALVLISAHAMTLRVMAAPPPPTPTPTTRHLSPDIYSTVCFYRDQALACVDRTGLQKGPQPGDEARALIQALVDGPTPAERATGIRSTLPDGAQLADVIVAGDAITVKLVLPESFLYGGLDPLVSDEITEQVVKTLYGLDQLRKFNVLAQDPRDASGTFKPLSYFLFEPPVTHKAEASQPQAPTSNPSATLRTSLQFSTGMLSGKGVYLSAGHGWYWDGFWNQWRTQRYADSGQQLIEDMNNAEVVNQYLIQYLRNAGADVWPVREHDMNTQEMIVVHGQPAYSEVGSWYDSTQTGYQGQTYRYANSVTSGASATATWTFTPTAPGQYAVYVWYKVYDASAHASGAQYFVVHNGGTTEVHVNQAMHGNTWRYIGTFPFAANAPGAVMLTNHSTANGMMVTADAVRVGGGMGTETGDGPPASPGTSGKPRWEEAARYWAEYQGAPSEIYAPSYCHDYYQPGQDELCQDVTVRPRYAEWEHESSQDSVYLSWHSNGYDGSVRGTESYIYDGDSSVMTESAELQSWVHSTLISDIRAGWDSTWTDRGTKQANLGELRPLETMPGTLVEVAFHDQADDANALKDPRFAQLTARAIYKGIVRYFAEKDFTTPVILPEPPQNLVVRNSGLGQVTVSWRPSPADTIGLLGDAATGYRVYTSTDGLGWSEGAPVPSNVFTLTGLSQGIVFVRVTATNAGGESFPTPVAAARVGIGSPAPVLIVNGYERIDRLMDVMRCDTPSANCPNARIWPAQMNDQSYIVQHGTAITLPFDSAMRGAVDSGDVTLDAYDIVDWIAGQEQVPMRIPNGTNEVALTQAERDALAAYLSGGHALFISGAEVAFDLATNTNSQSFLAGTLHAQFAGDDANAFVVTPTVGGIFAGVGQFGFDDGTHGSYVVNYPDFITPTNGSIATLNYVTTTGKTAAVEYANECQRLVYLGFPFETIYPAATRQIAMTRAMNFFSVCLPPSVAIASPAQDKFYKSLPATTGLASDWTQVDHVDVAMVQVTVVQALSGTAWVPLTPTLRFLSGTGWVTSETWLSATGSTTWSFTPTITLADGPYAVWARAWNSAGLSSTQIAVISFTMDTIAPTMPTPITPTGGITLSRLSVPLVFSPGIDLNGVAGYNVRVDGALYTTTATTLSVSGLSVGSHTWDVRAFDAAGNTSDWSPAAAFASDRVLVYLPLITRDYTTSVPPATRCREVVTNGGFETQSAWYSVASVPPIYVQAPDVIYSGTASLLIGYTTTVNVPTYTVYSSIQQTITIPFTATQTTLTFWRYPMSSDSRDYQYVSVGPTPTSATTIIWSRASNEQAWTPTVVDLSTYSGTLTLRFGVVNRDGEGVTAMYLDDVSVQSCSP